MEDAMQSLGLDALLVRSPEKIWYLHGLIF
jgi:hypothetical protein